MDDIDRRIIERLQGGFPICEEPFAAAAAALGIDADELMRRIGAMLADRTLTRFGPMYQVERMGGSFVLAALAAPGERFEEIAAVVNAQPEVAHNYRRAHRLNMWFVVATETVEESEPVLRRIEREAGVEVLAFPKEREYFVEMRLPAAEASPARALA